MKNLNKLAHLNISSTSNSNTSWYKDNHNIFNNIKHPGIRRAWYSSVSLFIYEVALYSTQNFCSLRDNVSPYSTISFEDMFDEI